MRFKDYLKEAVIDIPRKGYAKGVFDEADTDNPKIKDSVKSIIDGILQKIEDNEGYSILKTGLIGSILTKRYRNDADLDINVLFSVPPEKQEEERLRLSKKYLSADSPVKIQGKLIPGTEHPINFYFITDKQTYDEQESKADAVFDIENNQFIKRPEDFTFDPDLYVKDLNRKVQELDVVKGELKRDIIDYNELKDLSPNDVLNLQEKIKDKLEEIEDSIEDIVKIGDTVDAERRAAFDTDMSPDEIRQYGVKNRLPKAVIYKMLEKYHYLKFYKNCKKILEDGIVTDKEIDDLEIHEELRGGIFSVWDTLIRKTVKAPRIKMALQLYLKYLRQGVKDAKNKAAQHSGLEYREFGLAVADAGLPENFTTEQREGNSVAFTFGRFNPPTIGHEKLINKVAQQPTDKYFIYLSRSQDKNKNPLTPRDKLDVMKKMFPRHARNIVVNPTNMVLDLATDLYNKGYTDVTMVAGSDRVREFEGILKKYNDVRNRHGYYNFDKIDVVSAGERDPDAEGATGMSASKMRAAAEKGDVTSFKLGLPASYKSQADNLMKKVRKGMNLAASYGALGQVHGVNYKPIANLNEYEQQQIRDLYIREMIFNIGDKVDYVKEDIQGKVVRRSTNYVVLEDNNNNLHKAWIWDCLPVSADREVEVREYNLDVDYGFEAVSQVEEDLDAQPQDKDVKKKKGTQPKKYYKQLSKDVKDKRADHFKSQDTTKGPYKAAPGDKGAKTKPSIHTKKFKQMYGENSMNEACWKGYKQVGFKKKGGKQVPNCVPESMSIEDAKKVEGYVVESYEIGADYANHTKEVTPGEKPEAKPIDAKDRGKPDDNVKKEDVEKWAFSDETIDKYKKRYAEEWRNKLDEVVQRMLEKL
jgi:hypothetical protein